VTMNSKAAKWFVLASIALAIARDRPALVESGGPQEWDILVLLDKVVGQRHLGL